MADLSGANLTGAGLANNGGLTVRTSTFSGNHAADRGGAIYTQANTVFIENTTIAGNTAGTNAGAGVWSQGAGGAVTLGHVTVAGNTGNSVSGNFSGAGVASLAPATLTLANSLIGGNRTGQGGASDLFGDLSAIGANLVEAHSGDVLSGAAPIAADPNLVPAPGMYGGPTATMPPRPGSPAVNGGILLDGLPATDQRGGVRVVGGTPDLGAYESGNAAGYAAWAVEMIPEGLDAAFLGDAENDGSANGTEYALGTGVLISDRGSPANLTLATNASGEVEITFGLNPVATVDTKWVIKRSTDLVSFTEIYSYHGPTGTSNPGANISAVVGATSITVTDQDPPSPRAFYKFEAEEL